MIYFDTVPETVGGRITSAKEVRLMRILKIIVRVIVITGVILLALSGKAA
jgi:hypothetical protein